ncbi:ABC transporter ATP-binding protein [Cytophagaceae bacterium DM2B3-1]|uniref:ABC transporter ATP-binding protein n=1 Tax=Xanthocytophaga flava TaxID=3048013 RepID=A0ABT7CPB6_9BACT|nr:ABC transporter ATP-binding protein [Xanthocytophaga flavus]MDJ1468725.1 ABC transporter ATP-binding protein [Xanthocytophaga flavus]MDJ1495585.1 ABC transporter ATP-binding protein [Xanthocytophaga flavus]
MKHLAYLNKYLIKYKWHLLLGTLFTIISNLFAVVPAQVVRYAFDLVKETIDQYFLLQGTQAQEHILEVFAKSILMYGVVILVMAVIKGIFLFFMRQTIIVMSRLIEYDLKNEIYMHYQTLPLSFYRRNNTGDLMARISEDVSRVRMYLGPAIMYLLNMVTLVILVVGYMLSVNAKLTLYVLLPFPFLVVSIYFVNEAVERRSERIQAQLSKLSTFVQEAFSGIRVLKSFVRESHSATQFTDAANDYKAKSLRLTTIDAFFYPLIMALVGLSTILTIYIGGREVISGSLTAGNIAEFIMYVYQLTWPIASLGFTTSMIVRAAASQQRINEFLQTKTDIVSEKNIVKPIQGTVTFENVRFVYPDSGIVALDNVSFEVGEGQSIALLGTTGSGKSTIAMLLCRMYDVTQGHIRVDGVDIRDYSLPSLRGQIGFVPQDVFLFSDSIRNNIRFGLEEDAVTEDQIIQAAKDADLYENIVRFPEGFDTRVGERGITLSGGQKQRVSIARAIVREPRLLILDDALSAVDTKTENAILHSLSRIMKGRTSVIISHRVSSAKLADRIIVLDEGQIVEQGTHESLIQQNGVYKELYEKQLQTEEV